MKSSTRKPATEEQKAAAKERRAEIAKMMGTIKAMPTEKRVLLAARFGIRNAEGRELSVYNQCLLIAQNEKTTIVGGFQQWKKLGRSVKKGSRALAIWVPCSRKAEGAGGSSIIPHGVDPSDLDESFFVLGNVFDIAQTETEAEKLAREGDEALEAAARPRLPTSEALDIDAAEVITAPAPFTLPESRQSQELSPAERGEAFSVPQWIQAPEREGWQETTGRAKGGRVIFQRGSDYATYDAAADQMDLMPAALTIWDVEAPAPGQQLLISPPRKPAAVVAEKAPETMPTEQDEFDLLAA